MSVRFTESWSDEIKDSGAFSERDWDKFWIDMKQLIEYTPRSAYPATVVQAFERIEKYYEVPARLSEPMRMYFIRKASFKGCVPVIRCLVERWDCPLPLAPQDWRGVSLHLEWSAHEDQRALFLEWSAARENHLLRRKHASLKGAHPEMAEAL